MAAYLCRISNLHWFKCPPTCPQDDFHACMNQNKFTRAIFICEKLNNGTPIHLGIIWENLGHPNSGISDPNSNHFLGLPRLKASLFILPRKEFELAKLQAKNQRKNGESCARELLEILGINMFLISGPLFKLGYVHVHTLLF